MYSSMMTSSSFQASPAIGTEHQIARGGDKGHPPVAPIDQMLSDQGQSLETILIDVGKIGVQIGAAKRHRRKTHL